MYILHIQTKNLYICILVPYFHDCFGLKRRREEEGEGGGAVEAGLDSGVRKRGGGGGEEWRQVWNLEADSLGILAETVD